MSFEVAYTTAEQRELETLRHLYLDLNHLTKELQFIVNKEGTNEALKFFKQRINYHEQTRDK